MKANLTTENNNQKSVSEIKADIQKWNDVRNISPLIISDVLGFTINLSEFNKWKLNKPTHIHCYIGITQTGSVTIYLVDDITDMHEKNYKINENLFQKQCITDKLELYIDELKQPLFFKQAHLHDEFSNRFRAESRIANWMIWSKDWLTAELIAQKDIFRVITVPFCDIEALFDKQGSEPSQESINAIFALKYFDEPSISTEPALPIGYNVELILSRPSVELQGDTDPVQSVYFDVSRPKPPFSIELTQFNLLPQK